MVGGIPGEGKYRRGGGIAGVGGHRRGTSQGKHKMLSFSFLVFFPWAFLISKLQRLA